MLVLNQIRECQKQINQKLHSGEHIQIFYFRCHDQNIFYIYEDMMECRNEFQILKHTHMKVLMTKWMKQ